MLRGLTSRPAVTLLETLLVVSMIGVLLSLTLPAVQQVRAAASRAACQNSLRQVAIALHSHEALSGPAPRIGPVVPGVPRPIDQSMSWFTLILPHLGYDATWQSASEAYAATDRLEVDPPHFAQRAVIGPYRCRADDRLSSPLTDAAGVTASFTSFVGVYGNLTIVRGKVVNNGVMALNGLALRLADVADGTSQTLMVGERPPDDGLRSGWWYRYHEPPTYGPDIVLQVEELDTVDPGGCRQTGPWDGIIFYHFGPGRTSNPCDRFHYWSLHPGGANFAFADGSVRFLPYSAVGIMHALGSRNGGEVVTLPE